MPLKYFGMRTATRTNGSFRIIIPKELIKTWEKEAEEFIPLCFIKDDYKIYVNQIESVLKNEDYDASFLESILDDWIKYREKILIKRERTIERQYIEGKIDVNTYKFKLDKRRDSFKDLARKFRRAITSRKIELLITKKYNEYDYINTMLSEEIEKTELTNTIINDIKKMKHERDDIYALLKTLELNKDISKNHHKKIKNRYESILKRIEERIERIKKELCYDD